MACIAVMSTPSITGPIITIFDDKLTPVTELPVEHWQCEHPIFGSDNVIVFCNLNSGFLISPSNKSVDMRKVALGHIRHNCPWRVTYDIDNRRYLVTSNTKNIDILDHNFEPQGKIQCDIEVLAIKMCGKLLIAWTQHSVSILDKTGRLHYNLKPSKAFSSISGVGVLPGFVLAIADTTVIRKFMYGEETEIPLGYHPWGLAVQKNRLFVIRHEENDCGSIEVFTPGGRLLNSTKISHPYFLTAANE
jgi:hypothetical protein